MTQAYDNKGPQQQCDSCQAREPLMIVLSAAGVEVLGWKEHEHWLAPGPNVVWWEIEMEQENKYEPSLHETV